MPPPSPDFSSVDHNSVKNGGSSHEHHHQEISRDNLLNLFTSQQDLLNHFFKHLDLSQTLEFARILLSSSGTVFFTGVGKSAFVANKVSQTLVSLSFRSSFLSPLDALHGDISALSTRDVLVFFSKLCPFNLAPVTSTAIQMVFGDTIAVALMAARNLSKEEYVANHPAGKEGDLIMDQLVELTSKGCGCLLVVDEHYHLIGTFTDGDLRRTLKASGEAIFKLCVGEMCNRKPRTIGAEIMAVEAMKKMESPPSPVQFLPVVVGEDNTLI